MAENDELPPRPTRQVRRDSRGELIDAALQIILSKGVDALRVEDVCEQVGVTKGSLYWHFHDREGLIRAALLEQLYRIADEQLAVLGGAIESAASTDDYLAKVVGAFINPFDPDEVNQRWQRLEIIIASRRDPTLAAMMSEVQQRQQKYMTDIMVKAVDRGLLRSDADPKAVAAVLTAVSLGSTNLSLLGEDGPTPEAWMELMLLMIKLLFPAGE
jgi:AcrR family transcriptional regulator